MLKLLNIFTISLLLTSCTFEPKYTKPELSINNNWPQNIDLKANINNNISNISYKDFFKSVALQRVIEEALVNNHDLRIATLNIESAQATYNIQNSNTLPNLDLQFDSTRSLIPKNISKTGDAMHSTVVNANIATSFEIDLFSRVRSLNKIALESYFATKEAQRSVKITLIAAVANSYLQWLADLKNIEIANDILSLQKEYYNLIKMRYEKGIGSKIDLMQAQTFLENANANKASYEKIADQDKTTLILLVGSSNNKIFDNNFSFDQVQLMQHLPIDLPSEVLANRPDIIECEHQLKAQYAHIGAAKAAFFPKISLTGSLGFANDSLNGLFNSSSGAWSFIPQITLPIFNMGKNKANFKIAKISQQIAIINYEKVIQTAFKEVADGLSAFSAINNQLNAQDKLLETAKTTYNLSSARYKIGSDSFLNLVTAQQNYYLAQQNQLIVKQMQYSNLINLYKSLGGGT